MKRLQSKKPNQEVLERLLYLFAHYTLEMAHPNTKSIMTIPASHTSTLTLPTSFFPSHTYLTCHIHRSSGSSQTN